MKTKEAVAAMSSYIRHLASGGEKMALHEKRAYHDNLTKLSQELHRQNDLYLALSTVYPNKSPQQCFKLAHQMVRGLARWNAEKKAAAAKAAAAKRANMGGIGGAAPMPGGSSGSVQGGGLGGGASMPTPAAANPLDQMLASGNGAAMAPSYSQTMSPGLA